MKTSENGIQFIENCEGFVEKPLPDPIGLMTAGFGHKMRPGELCDTITREEARALLIEDLAPFEALINKHVLVEINQNQFDALASLSYNSGATPLTHSTLIDCLNNGDYDGAANEFPKWCHAHKDGELIVLEGLKNRRLAEQKLFQTPTEN